MRVWLIGGLGHNTPLDLKCCDLPAVIYYCARDDDDVGVVEYVLSDKVIADLPVYKARQQMKGFTVIGMHKTHLQPGAN